MRFRKSKSAAQPTGRQRFRGTQSYQAPASFSYSARRAEETINTGRKLPRDLRPAADQLRRFWLRRFGAVVLLLALVISVTNILTLSPRTQMMPLTSANSAFLQDRAIYQKAADTLLAQSVLNRNKITVNTNDISRKLTAQFPELSSVSVTIPLLAHRPVVYIEPVQPALLLHTSSDRYVVGANGRALLAEEDADASIAGKLPVVNDQSNLTVKLNQQALTEADVRFIQTVLSQLESKQFQITNMTLPAGSRELDVYLNGRPFFVKFNLQDSAGGRQQAGTFLATANMLDKKHITPSAYIDVRVEGRAYYK